MDDSEKINMKINIGGQPVWLTVPFGKQDMVRDVEAEIGRLYASWRKTFPSRDNHELLAMIAYQYASHYKELSLKYEDAARLARECEEGLDAIGF